MHIWKTLKLFISSTYKDLERERDALAGVFQALQREVFARRLHLIPYDMRWRDADEKDLVRWCLETVRDCDYFVGILGYRYGWRPPYGEKGRPNPERLSITEMEINQALQTIPPERRLFCFGAMEQYSDTELTTETAEDLASLEALKQRLLDMGETVLVYEHAAQVPTWIHQQLQTRLDTAFPKGQQAHLESYSRREALLEMIEEKRRGFVGQQHHLQQLEQFCTADSDDNYLAIHAVAGTGKSALLAAFLHEWEQEHPDVPVVAHYMSMAGESRSVAGLMQSLGEQLQHLGLLEEALELAPDQLIPQVRSALQGISQRLVLAIDGLDEMDEEGHDLSWLPPWLHNQVRVILTTRPVSVWHHLQTFPHIRTLLLPPLEEKYIRQIIQFYRETHQLTISPEEENILCQRADGSPLFLKVALDEMVAGGVAVGQLAETIDALFHQILERLQRLYGAEVIRHYLGVIAASRNGLVEIELRELLASEFSASMTDDFLLRVQHSLANFVIQREKLLNFFHPEFARTVKMLLGKAGMRRYHQRLATYFQGKGYHYERALLGLPYQLQWGEEYEALLRLFGDIRFLQAKCEAGMVADLRNDLAFALSSIAVPVPASLQIDLTSGVVITRELLRLLMRIVDFEFHFLSHHPHSLFQSLWNRGYWHDSEAAAVHYPEAGEEAPWRRGGPKLSALVEWWHEQVSSQRPWIQTLRPLPDRLDSAMRKMFRGHEELVTSVCMSQDGATIVSGSWDRTIRVWDVHSGQCLLVLRGHDDFLSAVCLTPDDRKIISGSGDNTMRVWDVQSGQCLQVLAGHTRPLATVACHPRGNLAVSGSKDKSVRVWDLTTGACLHVLEGHQKVVNSVCFSADGAWVVSGAWDNTVRVWDVATGACLSVLEGHTDDVKSVCISADRRRIFSASKDQTVRIWDATTGDCLHVLPHNGTVFSVAVSRDGKRIATGVYGTLRLWDAETGKLLLRLEGHESAIYGLFLNAAGQLAVTGSGDKTIRLWDISSVQSHLHLDSHARDIRGICLRADGRLALSASKDHTVRLWDTQTGLPVGHLQGHDGAVSCLHLCDDGVTLVTGSSDRTLRIWDLNTRQCTHVLSGHTKHITSVFLRADGQHLVSGSRENSLRLWDLSTGECYRQLEGHHSDVRAVFWHSSGRWLVSGSEDRSVKLWDASTGVCLQTLQGHTDGVLSVGMSADGRRIYSSSRDNTLRVWDIDTGDCLQVLEGRGEVHQLSFPYYAMAGGIETTVSTSAEHQPVVSFPTILRQASMSRDGIICGYAGVHLLLARLQSAA